MNNKNLPNCITAFRIAGAVLLIFTASFSPAFYAVYTLCGVSDVADGFIARKFKTESELGSKLDSVADLLFYAVMLFKLIPTFIERLTAGIWCAIFAVLALRLASYIVAAVKYRRFASLHTYMNKATGLAVFSVPYFILLPFYLPLCAAVCAVAGAASAEELIIHLSSKEYEPERKTLMFRRNKTKK